MAIALVTNQIVASSGGADVTTSAVDTTGATLLVIGLSLYTQLDNTFGVTDSKSNTWQVLTKYEANESGTFAVNLFYCLSPIVGSGHTFSNVTSSGAQYPVLAVAAFSGVATYNKESGQATATQGTSYANVSLTPDNNNSLVVTAVCLRALT